MNALPLDRTRAALVDLDTAADATGHTFEALQTTDDPTEVKALADRFTEQTAAEDEAARAVCLAFAEDTADRNPTLRRDIESGLIGTGARGKLAKFARRMCEEKVSA